VPDPSLPILILHETVRQSFEQSPDSDVVLVERVGVEVWRHAVRRRVREGAHERTEFFEDASEVFWLIAGSGRSLA
jgi:hypothetical protein